MCGSNFYETDVSINILNCLIFNFKTFRAEILQIFEMVIWKIDDFINSF